MTVCSNCFADKELKAFISSAAKVGDCLICGSKATPQLDIKELLDFFQELINNFRRHAGGEKLKNIIQANWSFFSDHTIAMTILNEVLPQLTTSISNSDDLVQYDSDIIDNYSHWNVLKSELKSSRRYISDIAKLEDLGWDGFFNTQFELKSSDRLFRARLHHNSGLPAIAAADMMSPLPSLTSPGRANPSGIPYLYLSDNPDTVLYEIRGAYLDELSIGEFKLKDHIGAVKIVDFTEDTFLFQPSNVTQTIKAKLLRSIISGDLSKPMRRYDSELEYIPTQFICEFIKVFTGASGVRFGSSLHPPGKNIVIFDQSLMECIKVIVKRIHRLSLQSLDI